MVGTLAAEMFLDGLILQGGRLVLQRHLGHLAHFGLVHVLMLVALLRDGQDHHTGDMAGGGPKGQVRGNHRGAHGWHVLCAGIDEVLVPFPLAAAAAGLALLLQRWRGLWGWQGCQVQVVLVSLNEHLGCVAGSGELAIVHEWCEDGLWLWVFGLGVTKEAAELGDTAHGAPARVGELLLLALHRGHVFAPVIADAIHDDARENSPHDKSQNDCNGQEGDRNELVMAFEVTFANHSCNRHRIRC